MNRQGLMRFGEEIKELFLQAKIRAPVHLSRGNEEPLIEIFKRIPKTDWVFSTHRSHYHALLHGIDREWLRSEILEGRSIHVMNREHKFFSSAIVGGCLPIALGVAMAMKRRMDDYPKAKVWVFVGDMAAHTGMFHECTKYAQNHNLPICFVIEDNQLSNLTPTAEVWGIEEEPAEEGKVETVRSWGQGEVIRYRYVRIWPHQGAGKWVKF